MKYIYLLLIFLFLLSCASNKENNKVKVFTPFGNIEEVNDSLSQIAPTERPSYYYNDELAKYPYLREVKHKKENYNVFPSSKVATNELSLSMVDEEWRKYLTSNIESITFISKDKGFITFSHSFANEFAKKFNLNIKSESGGTNIYEFTLNPEKGFEFETLSSLEALNTSFWDSHPFAADTVLTNGERVTLLLWASDRDRPYSKAIDKDGKVKSTGGTDLFYAFRTGEKWSAVKKFDKINNVSNQASPFVYCLCGEESTLFYSSNEEGGESEFDIFYTQIKIDYEKQNINVLNKGKRFLKFGADSLSPVDSLSQYELINSKYDERFPYIPYPYSNDLKLYFSSNRFSSKSKINDTTALEAKGNYDIYALPISNEEFPCAPPKFRITYNLTVLNSANPTEEIPNLVFDIDNKAIQISQKGNKLVYELEADKEYKVYSGSDFSDDSYDCMNLEGGVLAGFTAPKIDDTNIEYEQVTSTQLTKLPIDNKKLIVGKTESKIEEDTISFNGLELISKNVITSTILAIDEKNNTYSVQETDSRMKAKPTSLNLLLGQTFNINENVNIIKGPEIPSLLTMKQQLSTKGINENTTIYDTVYIAPVMKEPYDINLKVYVIDKCTGKQVQEPIAEIVNSKGERSSQKVGKNGYMNFKLNCGETYQIFGGSNIKTMFGEDYDFPKSQTFKYFSAADYRIPAEGARVESEKTKYGGLNTNEINSNAMLVDTVYLVSTPDILYTVEIKNAKRPSEKIKDPVLLIRNVTTGKDLKLETNKFSFYPNPNHQYRVFGGSNYDGMECEDNKSYIERGYYAPKYENGVYKLDIDYDKIDLTNYTKVKGAMVGSLFSNTSNFTIIGNEECKSKIINDLVYLIPEEYIKPPCSVEFVNFEGYHRNVPYFQTGFWEVNTAENVENHIKRLEDGFDITDEKITRNRSDYKVSGELVLYPIIQNDGFSYSIANARWIELHPNNYYWGWRPDLYLGASKERVGKREKRKLEYKKYANQVSQNLDIMTNSILNDVLPKFEEIKRLNPENTGTKLLIEIKALSDKRGVERGWYIGENDINYTASYYDRYAERIVSRSINIDSPEANENNKTVSNKVNLGLKNKVLSDLRAWYGYKEIIQRVSNHENFKKYADNNKVLTPENYTKDLSNYDIVILANGEDIDEYIEAQIKMYDKTKRKQSYFAYDQTRRVEVIISIVNYQNGKVIKSDCCDKDAEFTNK